MTNFAFTVLTSYAPSVFYFGAKTLAGDGGVDIGASGIAIRAGDASGHWQITTASGRSILSPSATGDTADLSGGPYSLTFSDGSRATGNIVAAAKSVASLATLKTALQTSNAVGFIIYPRAAGASLGGGGDYSVSGAGDGITPVVSGAFTVPADYSAGVTTDYSGYSKGKNLSTGNHIRVMPHPNELLTISQRVQLTDAGKIRFSNITFNVLDPNGATSALNANGMLQFNGAADCAVDGCTFQSRDTISGNWDQYARRVGIYAVASGANVNDRLIVQDNTFNDNWYGVSVSSCANFCFVGNTIRHGWADAIKAPSDSNGRMCWNLLVDKWQPSDGTHPDFTQWNGAGKATDSTGWWVVGNLIVRGSGLAANQDGQGLFANDLGRVYTGTYSSSGTTCTVDLGANAHGILAGATVNLVFSGVALDGDYTVTSVTNNFIFVVTLASGVTESGSVTFNTTNKWNGWVVMGNRILCGYTNGIYFGERTGRANAVSANCWVYFNTALNDPTFDGIGNNTYIRWPMGRQASDSQKYNLANTNGTVDDIDVSRASGYAAYNTYLAGGFAAMGAGVGSTLASVAAATNVKTGSPADTASPKVGAHQAYFDYSARTISLPVTPPANP